MDILAEQLLRAKADGLAGRESYLCSPCQLNPNLNCRVACPNHQHALARERRRISIGCCVEHLTCEKFLAENPGRIWSMEGASGGDQAARLICLSVNGDHMKSRSGTLDPRNPCVGDDRQFEVARILVQICHHLVACWVVLGLTRKGHAWQGG